MKCPDCGFEEKDGALVCGKCSAALEETPTRKSLEISGLRKRGYVYSAISALLLPGLVLMQVFSVFFFDNVKGLEFYAAWVTAGLLLLLPVVLIVANVLLWKAIGRGDARRAAFWMWAPGKYLAGILVFMLVFGSIFGAIVVFKNLTKKAPASYAEALAARDMPAVKSMLAAGAPISTDEATLALVEAVSGDDSDLVRLLVDKGARLDARSGDGWSLLLNATAGGNMSVIGVLLEKGANVDDGSTVSPGRAGFTPLMRAAMAGNLSAMSALLARSARVNGQSKKGMTAAMYAVDGITFGNVIEQARRDGVRHELEDKTGSAEDYPVRDKAAQELCVRTLKLLLQHKADLNLRTDEGKTVLGQARNKDRRYVAAFLAENGAIE